VIPYAGVFRDSNLREDISLEKMAELKPVFDKAGGTITAANSTPLTDGASTVLLASEEWAGKRDIPVQAYLTFGRTAAVDYVAGEGLLMAPTVAVSDLLSESNLTLQDFDFYEIHEAFAAQVLCTLKAWESDNYCRNRLGRDRALGHPFAATGARILAVLAKLLHTEGGCRGLISVCTAGGMGVAAILEGTGSREPARGTMP
jgi:acetyl-CoA C-acetyltransferase